MQQLKSTAVVVLSLALALGVAVAGYAVVIAVATVLKFDPDPDSTLGILSVRVFSIGFILIWFGLAGWFYKPLDRWANPTLGTLAVKCYPPCTVYIDGVAAKKIDSDDTVRCVEGHHTLRFVFENGQEKSVSGHCKAGETYQFFLMADGNKIEFRSVTER